MLQLQLQCDNYAISNTVHRCQLELSRLHLWPAEHGNIIFIPHREKVSTSAAIPAHELNAWTGKTLLLIDSECCTILSPATGLSVARAASRNRYRRCSLHLTNDQSRADLGPVHMLMLIQTSSALVAEAEASPFCN